MEELKLDDIELDDDCFEALEREDDCLERLELKDGGGATLETEDDSDGSLDCADRQSFGQESGLAFSCSSQILSPHRPIFSVGSFGSGGAGF